jgi:PAS domain S-box-containing protein
VPGYSRDAFIEALVEEHVGEIRRCFAAGAATVQIDFTEGRLALKVDPSGQLLNSFIDLNNLALARFSLQERARIGVHTCPGGDRDSTHSADVDYTDLIPSLFQLKAGRFYVALAGEPDRTVVLRLIRDHRQPDQHVFVGVVAPIDPRVESPAEVRDRTLEAAAFIPPDRLGTTDDCGFSPFFDDTSTSRDVAFAKIRAGHRGWVMADDREEELLRSVAPSDDAIISKTLDGVIRTWNVGAERLFGYTAAEAIGRPITLIIPPERHTEEEVILARLRRGERIDHYETVRVARDGRRLDIALTVSPMRDATGLVIGAAKVARDITERKRAEEGLRDSERRFRLLAETVPLVVWTAAPDGTITYANERWYEYTGLTPEQNARHWHELVLHPEDQARCLEAWARALRDGSEYEVEVRNRRRDGVYRWFVTRAVPTRDAAGQVVQWFGTTTDIDDRKRAEQTSRFLADASTALAELTDYQSTLHKVAVLAVPYFADWCAVDMREPDGSVRRLAVAHADPAKVELARELMRRYPPDPAAPRGLMRVLRTGEPDWMPAIPEELLEQVTRDAEHLRIIRELGLRSYICVPLKSHGGLLGALTFVTAESGRVYDTGDLRAAEDLAHRAVIAIENANLLAALRETDRRKDEFLALLAHELRNPLAPLRNGLQVLRLVGGLPEVVAQTRDMMDRQLSHMVRLVDDLLDVSRISRGKLELRRAQVRLADVLTSAVESASPLIEEGGHKLEVSLPEEPIVLDADLTRLAQVFANLLTNSAKYTAPGGRIRVAARREGAAVVVSVHDNGIGIPTEMLTEVFNMFSQVDRSMERTSGGLGIGLALVKGLVEMHGGTVTADSPGPGGGSTFTVRLPVVGEYPPGSTPTDEPAGQAAGRRVLVVDDNRDGAESLAEMLRLLGHETHTAHDGVEAVEAAERLSPDLILMDVGMPRLNGLDATRRIRERPWGRDVVVIALTGWGQDADRERSRDAGCDGHLVKPVELAALQRLLTETRRPSPAGG